MPSLPPAPGQPPSLLSRVLTWLGHSSAMASLALLVASGSLHRVLPAPASDATASAPVLGPVWAVAVYDSAAIDPQSRALLSSPLVASAAHRLGASWAAGDVSETATVGRLPAAAASIHGLPCLVIQVGDAASGNVSLVTLPLPRSEAEAVASIRKAVGL